VLATGQPEPSELEVLRPDVRVRQQIGLMICGGQQLRRPSAAGEQATNAPRWPSAHLPILASSAVP
jgi:hypothetical protein